MISKYLYINLNISIFLPKASNSLYIGVPTATSNVPYYRVTPSDTELFPLTVGHNVNLNKLHAVLIVL